MTIRSLAIRSTLTASVATLFLASSIADARDTVHKFPLEPAVAKAEASGKLAPGIKLFFGNQKHPKPTTQLGPTRTNKKTNFFNKTDQEGCDWAFLSSMIALTQYAQRVGGNAIVNIRSTYRTNVFSSATEYECGAGAGDQRAQRPREAAAAQRHARDDEHGDGDRREDGGAQRECEVRRDEVGDGNGDRRPFPRIE